MRLFRVEVIIFLVFLVIGVVGYLDHRKAEEQYKQFLKNIPWGKHGPVRWVGYNSNYAVLKKRLDKDIREQIINWSKRFEAAIVSQRRWMAQVPDQPISYYKVRFMLADKNSKIFYLTFYYTIVKYRPVFRTVARHDKPDEIGEFLVFDQRIRYYSWEENRTEYTGPEVVPDR